jgi:hypothetical protein
MSLAGRWIRRDRMSAWTRRQLTLGRPKDCSASFSPIPKRSASPRATSTLTAVDNLKALDPNRPIREADMCGASVLTPVNLQFDAKVPRRWGSERSKIFFMPPSVFKHMSVPFSLAATTIASRCTRVVARWASRQLRYRRAKDGRRCAVPNATCLDGNGCRGIEGCSDRAEGNGHLSGE